MSLFSRSLVPILVSSARGTVVVSVDQETCLWHAALLVRIAGEGVLLKVGVSGAAWTYGLDGGEA